MVGSMVYKFRNYTRAINSSSAGEGKILLRQLNSMIESIPAEEHRAKTRLMATRSELAKVVERLTEYSAYLSRGES